MNMNAAKQSNKRSRKSGNSMRPIVPSTKLSFLLQLVFSEKVMEKTADELELEEFLFGKDIINSRPAKEEEEIEVRFSFNTPLLNHF